MRSRGIDAPTVMMTGVEREGTREICLAAGAVDLLAKPVDARTITNLLDRFSGRRPEGTTE
jgi:CheY-like chemotaxis protein